MRTVLPKNAILVPEHATCVFKGEIFEVYQWPEQMFDGSMATFEMLKKPDSVEVLVIDNNKILVQKQEQPHLGHFMGFPGGRHDYSSETELEACKRELREESGYSCENWKLLSVKQAHPKIESFFYIYLATGIIDQVPMMLDAGEKIENAWMTLSEVRELVAGGNFRAGGQHLFGDAQEANDLLTLREYTV